MSESPADKAFGWIYKQPGDPNITDVRKAVAAIEAKFGMDEARNLLSRFGVGVNINDLWIGDYRRLIELAAACLEWNYPPSGSWEGCLPRYAAEMV